MATFTDYFDRPNQIDWGAGRDGIISTPFTAPRYQDPYLKNAARYRVSEQRGTIEFTSLFASSLGGSNRQSNVIYPKSWLEAAGWPRIGFTCLVSWSGVVPSTASFGLYTLRTNGAFTDIDPTSFFFGPPMCTASMEYMSLLPPKDRKVSVAKGYDKYWAQMEYLVTPLANTVQGYPRFKTEAKYRVWPLGVAQPTFRVGDSRIFTYSPSPGFSQSEFIAYRNKIRSPKVYLSGGEKNFNLYFHYLQFYNSASAEDEPFKIEDEFIRPTSSNRSFGWTRTLEGQHWYGYANYNPAVTGSTYVKAFRLDGSGAERGGVIDTSVAPSLAAEYVFAPVGTPKNSKMRLESSFSYLSGGDGQRLDFAPCMELTASTVPTRSQGVFARVVLGSTTVQIVRWLSGAPTVLGTGTLAEPILLGQTWFIEIERNGHNAAFEVKVWKSGTTKPATNTATGTEPNVSGGILGYAGIGTQLSGVATYTHAKIFYFNIKAAFTTDATTPGAVLTPTSILANSAAFEQGFSGDVNANNSAAFYWGKVEDNTWYLAFTTVNISRNPKKGIFSVTNLEENTEYQVRTIWSDSDGVDGGPVFATFTTPVFRVKPLFEQHSAIPINANTVRITAPYDEDDNETSSATVEYKVQGTSTWSAPLALTMNRVTKIGTRDVTGISSDVVYNFRVVWSDPNGIVDTVTTWTANAEIAANAVKPLPLTFVPQIRTIVVRAPYEFDENSNSSVAIQYRPVSTTIWTTVPSNLIHREVGATPKRFSTTVSGLYPNTTYEFKAVFSDVNGVVSGSVDTLYATATTISTQSSVQRGQFDQTRSKKYVWKAYASNGTYVGTWNDVSVPEFSFYENGGVSDLTVRVFRPLNLLGEPDQTIKFQNIIDIYASDPFSEGLGENLVEDSEGTLGRWVTSNGWSLVGESGPDFSEAFRYVGANSVDVLQSEFVDVIPDVPHFVSLFVRTEGRMDVDVSIQQYGEGNELLGEGNTSRNVGKNWQRLIFDVNTTPLTKYLVVEVRPDPTPNSGSGKIWVDKLVVKPKTKLIYRGVIESYTSTIDQSGENIEVRVLGLVAQLSDDYINFLQYVSQQPAKDQAAGRPNNGPTDPSQMLRDIIDQAQRQNDRFLLYYTAESIRDTGRRVEYTFREQLLRSCFDKVRELCPPGWHYYVEPDGLVSLRGPEHVATHKLRIGVEVMNISVEQTIQNLKNYVLVKGRTDEDNSESDGFGSIRYVTFDQDSIDKYGKRMLVIRDSNITDPDTAQIVGDGRLEEFNRSEQRVEVYVPDNKTIFFTKEALRGFDIEQFKPGDQVAFYDPVAGPRNVYWGSFTWDEDPWDVSNEFAAIAETVPIKKIQYHGDYVLLELNERQPSAVGDFGRLYRWLQLEDADKGEET